MSRRQRNMFYWIAFAVLVGYVVLSDPAVWGQWLSDLVTAL